MPMINCHTYKTAQQVQTQLRLKCRRTKVQGTDISIALVHQSSPVSCNKTTQTGVSILVIERTVCLFGFNVALKHLRSYHDGACLYFDQCAAIQICHAADT